MKRLLHLPTIIVILCLFFFIPQQHVFAADGSCSIAVQTPVTYGDSTTITVSANPPKAPLFSAPYVPLKVTLSVGSNWSKTVDYSGKGGKKFTVKTTDLESENANQTYPVTASFTYGTVTGISQTIKVGDGSCHSDNDLVITPNSTQPVISTTPTPSQAPTAGMTVNNPASLNQGNTINGYTNSVTMTFTDISGAEHICLLTDQDKCINNSNSFSKASLDSNNSITLCGNGTSSLKSPCDDSKDYFHEGYIYTIGLYSTDFQAGSIASQSFYVYHSYPSVIIKTSDNGSFDVASHIDSDGQGIRDDSNKSTKISNPIEVIITQPYKIGKKTNDFQILLQSSDQNAKISRCLSLPKGQAYQPSTNSLTLSDEELNNPQSTSTLARLPAGSYSLYIKEGVNDSGIFDSGCDGGFTYYKIPITIKKESNIANAYIDPSQLQKDPDNIETNPFGINTKGNIIIPCAEGARDPNTGGCATVDTALGPINTNPLQLMGSLMTYFLSISGAIILLQFIYSGYQILLSRGDKEKINAARQRITSSIIGFVFIVLSLVILQIIGVNILNIPGFTK